MELNLETKTANQVIATSKRTATITFEDAHQCEISKEIQREKIGRSSSEVQVELIIIKKKLLMLVKLVHFQTGQEY